MLYNRRVQKNLQYRPNSYLQICEWSEPRATAEEFQRLVARAVQVVFDHRPVPMESAGQLLHSRCQTLMSVVREDDSEVCWRIYLASEKGGPEFEVDFCRRITNRLFIGFHSVLYSLDLDSGSLRWAIPLDGARFQALRVPSEKKAVIVHGTGSMYRVNLDGRVEWETFGPHDFGDDLRLCQDVIEVRDTERNIYLIDYRTGDFAIRPPPLAERLKQASGMGV